MTSNGTQDKEATMTYEAITVTPCSPHIGAEIGNIDLTKPLSNQEVAELHQAFADHLQHGTPLPLDVDDAVTNMHYIDTAYTAAGMSPR